jgi:hypothetical protein
LALRSSTLAVLLLLAVPATSRADETCTLDGKTVPNISMVRDGTVRCTDSKTKKATKVYVLKSGSAVFTAHYAPNGQFLRLSCHQQEHVPADFLKTCGYQGPSEVTLFDDDTNKSTTKTLLNGRSKDKQDAARASPADDDEPKGRSNEPRTQVTKFPNGKPHFEIHYKGAYYDGDYKEFHESGKLVRHAVYENGSFRGEKAFYLNGKPKNEKTVQPRGDKWVVTVKTYFDTGVLESEESFEATAFTLKGQNLRLDNQVDVGKYYNTRGTLLEQRTFTKYRISATTFWDDDGKLLKSEEYFEDGSRK